MMRVYGLDLDQTIAGRTMPPARLADLAVFLPDGAQLWRAMDTSNAWTVTDHLLATLADQMNLWIWGNADRKRRGSRPQPIRRPGQGDRARPGRDDADQDQPRDGHEHTERRIAAKGMTVAELDAFMAQEFTTLERRH